MSDRSGESKGRTPWESYKSLKAREDFRFKKSLGQNILVDPNVISRIASASVPQGGERVLEIGPGTGALTAELLKLYDQVTVLELDEGMIRELRQDLGDHPNLTIVHGDVLKEDLGALGFNKVVANLPYSISTRAISRLMDFRAQGLIPQCQSIHALVQEEVADRIKAHPGEKDNGPLALKVQCLASASKLFRVSPNCFRPRPKINSALLEIGFLPQPPINGETLEKVMKLINFLFTMRRKKLSTSLGAFLSREGRKLVAAEVLGQSGIDLSERPEKLEFSHFMALMNTLESC